MQIKKDFRKIMQSESGIALMMIMTAMILLMAIYGEFTFESKISRIKATNIMDRSQAKLLAESGLQLAMARLQLYKEAFNKVESNPDIKKQVPAQLLNQLWEVPFMMPVPVGKEATVAMKDTISKFEKESILDGTMKVTIANISNRMNLNMIRYEMAKKTIDDQGNEVDNNDNGILDTSGDAIANDVSVDQSLYFTLRRLVEEKREKDESFDDRYSALNYQELVSNLRYFISDFMSLQTDPNAGEAQNAFEKIPLSPKYGPLASASELYAIPGWNDELIELIQSEFSVYPSAQIDLNKLTTNMLKVLIPTITEDQSTDFFKYRDDPDAPKHFNTLADFKNYVVTVARIVGDSDFDKRMELFQKAGVTFGSNPSLFKVVSEGSYNRSVYTLVAYVNMPKAADPATTGSSSGGSSSGGASGGTTTGSSSGGSSGGTSGGQTTQLLDPRIIELQIN